MPFLLDESDRIIAESQKATYWLCPAPRSWSVLTEAGFEFIGEWTHDPESLLWLDAKAPSAPGVYAFVVDDVVVYVGLTLSGLKTRFDQYRRGHKGQRTSSRINGQITEMLRCSSPRPSRWNGETPCR
jgi:hypothetical protein